MTRNLYIICFACCLCASVRAQDVHFSETGFSPLTLNPALTGQFDGQHRLAAIYRHQWSAVPVPFMSFTGSWDAQIKSTGLSAGLLLQYDRAGDSRLSSTQVAGAIAWTFYPLKKRIVSVSLGFLPSLNQRRFDPQQLHFDSQWNGDSYDASLGTGEQFNRTSFWYFDLATGGHVNIKLGKSRIGLGGSVYHLAQPNQAFLGDQGVRLFRRSSLYAEATLHVADRIDVLPSVLWHQQGPYQEVLLGSQLRYVIDAHFGDRKSILLGAGWRTGDAAVLSIGFEIQDWKFGFSYDINTSAFQQATGGKGGPEIGIIRQFIPEAVYTDQHFKRPCPFF